MMRRVIALTLVSALCFTFPPSPPAEAQTDAAVAVNTKDGFSIFRLSFMIRRVMRDVVDVTNAAVAYSSCSDCQTVAISIQAVLIMSDPELVEATNLAIAINQNCNTCDTLAAAYQYVLSTGGIVKFTKEGQLKIVEIRRQLLALRHSDLTIEEIAAEVDRLAGELETVLATELEVVGPPERDTATTTSSTTSTTSSTSSTSSTSTSTSTSTTTTTTTQP